jgi:hypothetical protein
MMLLIKANGQLQVMVDQPYTVKEKIVVYDIESIRLSDYEATNVPPSPESLVKERTFRWALSYGNWSIWLED